MVVFSSEGNLRGVLLRYVVLVVSLVLGARGSRPKYLVDVRHVVGKFRDLVLRGLRA